MKSSSLTNKQALLECLITISLNSYDENGDLDHKKIKKETKELYNIYKKLEKELKVDDRNYV